MKRKTLAATFALAFLVCSVAGLLIVAPVEAFFERNPEAPHIIIAADGSVNSTQGVKQDGNCYYLTEDIQGCSFVVDQSNIVLDGKGHLLNCTGYISHAILLQSVTNVTVKNFQIQGGASAVALMYGTTHCTVENITSNNDIFFSESNFNTVTRCTVEIKVWRESSNNKITENNITDLYITEISTDYRVASSFNCFYLNNILVYPSGGRDNFWDNGTIGNYWSD